MKGNLKFIVEEEAALLPFLLENVKNKSRNNIKGILKRGQVTINDTLCTDHARILRPGQVVEVYATVSSDSYKMEIPIIYEDNDIIVIDKPAGMLSISTDKESENTAYHIVTDYVKHLHPTARIFIVHRLDKDTSGVMLFAKNERIKNAFQDEWDNLVKYRGYMALVEGKVEPAKNTITSWLKQTSTLLVYSSPRDGDGKMAITNYEVSKASDKYSLLNISLETGRKNQIRVHMKDIGHPVVGDKKYGSKSSPLGRLGLHAYKLTLDHPFTGETMTFESKAPKAFTKIFSV